MKNDQDQWIKDFVHQRGAFQDPANLEFVDKNDLKKMRFYMDAAQEIFDQAKEAKSQTEYRRLMAVARTHLARVNELLTRYGQETEFRAEAKTTDDLVEELYNLV